MYFTKNLKNIHVKLYPNPVSELLTLEFELDQAQTLYLLMYNMLTQEVKDFEFEGKAGKNQIVFDLSAYAAQSYFLRIQHPQISLSKQIMLVR
ncbi:MAG: T9SS type A sorting domain-containing protein [Microscillaceae bacterium]|nr:T9SS type A sorting domain-containing protein [Microscillaceae bacterium]